MALVPVQPNFYLTSAHMASSHSMALNCPVPRCTRQFKTERAKDCLRVHLRYSKDEDHKDIYVARYSDHQRTRVTFYTCSNCRQTFEKKSRLTRHKSIRKYSLESRWRVVNVETLRSLFKVPLPQVSQDFQVPSLRASQQRTLQSAVGIDEISFYK